MRTYKPFTTEYTWQIIGDIKEYLEETNKSQTTLDTLDLCHLIGEIERLNNIIKTKDEGIKAFTEDLCEESAKIEKAIEYIEKHTENIDRGQYYEDYVETYPILQILKGSE